MISFHLRSLSAVLAAAGASAGLILAGVAAPASAATVAPEPGGTVPVSAASLSATNGLTVAIADTECNVRVEKEIIEWGHDLYNVAVDCSAIAPNTKVRGVLDFESQLDEHTDWFTDTGKTYRSIQMESGHLTDPSARIEVASLNEKNVCEVWRETEDKSWERDPFRVGASCVSLEPNTKVRGVLDITADTDRHTDWFTDYGVQHFSEWIVPNPIQTPDVRLEYAPN